MCKKAGSWTNNLFDLAKRVQYGENGGQISTVRVLVEGPYGKSFPSIFVSFFIQKTSFYSLSSRRLSPLCLTGGPGHTVFSSFSGAMFIAGGSGITFALGAIQDLVQKDLQGQSRLKVIELVWTISDPCT